MKRILCLMLSVLLLLSAVLVLPACSGKNKLPADYVKGDAEVIDNETPFVYDDSTVKYYYEKYNGETISFDISDFVYHLSQVEERDFSYAYIASVFGNKIVRHYTEGDRDTYYTVYSLPDNELFYLSLCMKDGALYLDKDPYSGLNETLDARWDNLNGYVYEQDFPAAILGDALPSDCYLDYYEPEEIERRNNLQWEFYGEDCSRAGIPTDPFTSDFYCDLYAQGRHKEVDGAIRCIQSVSFDTEEGDPESEDYTIHHGSYFYDIYIFTDGTGILFFTHFNTDVHPRYAVWQKEEIKLSVIEVQKLTTLLDVWDFDNIPTWNPAELSGFDGETTTVYTNVSGHHNLTSMWSASERDAVYHIREAIEEIVRDHVTVERGRIYNPRGDE